MKRNQWKRQSGVCLRLQQLTQDDQQPIDFLRSSIIHHFPSLTFCPFGCSCRRLVKCKNCQTASRPTINAQLAPAHASSTQSDRVELWFREDFDLT
uniref:Uncharacterized protein n=1 Tax=Ditylenchus dipsaci TaxID=166011 RepID=A0A915D1M4_9BILA